MGLKSVTDFVLRLVPSKQFLTSCNRISGGRQHAFTLLEVLAAAIIVSILVVVSIPSAGIMIARAQESACIANMRGITVGLHSYLQDHKNVWPQGPSLNEKKPWENFWLKVLNSYDVPEKRWQCPAFNSALASKGVPVDERSKVHYVPTTFPDTPGIATRWATQPWLIERASVHKHGPHICFPDGSVKSFNKVLAEQGVR
jgi:prepilin-type N-terminal cleavage/methylation domain-containing protein